MVIKSQALNYIQFAMMRRYDYGQKNQHFFCLSEILYFHLFILNISKIECGMCPLR